MANIFDQFSSLKGASFIAIKNYRSTTTNELSNVVLNTNINVLNLKKKDVETLKNCPTELLEKVAKDQSTDLSEVQTALNELITSAEKNLAYETATAQSKGQTDAYHTIGKGLRIHKESFDVHVLGLSISKEVLEKGNYKTVKSRKKTLIKKQLEKELNLKRLKIRTYKIKNSKKFRISGNEILINE